MRATAALSKSRVASSTEAGSDISGKVNDISVLTTAYGAKVGIGVGAGDGGRVGNGEGRGVGEPEGNGVGI